MSYNHELALEKAKLKAQKHSFISSPQKYAEFLKEEEEIFKRIEAEKSFYSLSQLFR